MHNPLSEDTGVAVCSLMGRERGCHSALCRLLVKTDQSRHLLGSVPLLSHLQFMHSFLELRHVPPPACNLPANPNPTGLGSCQPGLTSLGSSEDSIHTSDRVTCPAAVDTQYTPLGFTKEGGLSHAVSSVSTQCSGHSAHALQP